MFKYIFRRTIYMVPILFGVTLLTFTLFHVVGGDPAVLAAGKHATPEQIELIRQSLGLNRPLYVQYFQFLHQIFTLDFGRSWSSRQNIWTMFTQGVGPSLSLTLPAFLIAEVLTISLALLLARWRDSLFDRVTKITCLAMLSLSSLVYILWGQYVLAYKWDIFPISGWDPSWAGRWEFLGLPIVIFVLLSLGSNILFFRTVFLDEIYHDYVRTARAKGLNESGILFKHVLRNAMIPIITRVVQEMPFLILGSLLLESFFGIPGIGGLVVLAIQNADFPVIKAMTFLSAVLYMIFQLISDVLYAVVDPKIQLR
ncbi:MAG: ABC transporter permease [Bdellovibrionales bacterium]|nr:ABC transporter permease [Bdellovibrionales bacterium]